MQHYDQYGNENNDTSCGRAKHKIFLVGGLWIFFFFFFFFLCIKTHDYTSYLYIIYYLLTADIE